MTETDEFTVREFADKERVTTRTVRQWITKGAVNIRRTPGGGIRILERRKEPRAAVCSSMIFDDHRGSSSA